MKRNNSTNVFIQKQNRRKKHGLQLSPVEERRANAVLPLKRPRISGYETPDCMRDLTEREKIIVRIRNGLPLSMREVSQALGISHQRVSQIEHGAIRKLKRHFAVKGNP